MAGEENLPAPADIHTPQADIHAPQADIHTDHVDIHTPQSDAPRGAQERPLDAEAQKRMQQLDEVMKDTGNTFNERLYVQNPEKGFLKGKLKNWIRRLFFVGGGAMQPADFGTLQKGAEQFGTAQAALTAHDTGVRLLSDTVTSAGSTSPLAAAIGARDASLGVMGQGAWEAAGGALEAGAYTGGVSGLAQLAIDGVRVCQGERSRNLLARHLSHEGFMNFNEQMKNMTLKGNRHVIEQSMIFKERMKQGRQIPTDIGNDVIENMLTSAIFESNQIEGTKIIMPAEKWAKTMNGKDELYFKQVEDSVRVLQRVAAERFSPEEMIDLKSRIQTKLARKQAMVTTKAVAARTGITALKGFTGASLASAIIGGVKAWNPPISELPRRLLTQTARGVGAVAEGAIHVGGEVATGVKLSAPEWVDMWNRTAKLTGETIKDLMTSAPVPAETVTSLIGPR